MNKKWWVVLQCINLHFIASLNFFSAVPAELFALHVYTPASDLVIVLKVNFAVLLP